MVDCEYNNVFYPAIESSNLDMMKFLIKKGVDVF